MIIHLKKSALFTIHPGKRFAKEYNTPEGLWEEMYRRHKILEYTIEDLCDFYNVKTNKTLTTQAINRWIWRSKVFEKADSVMQRGVETVVSDFFGDFEYEVIKELLKNIKTSATQKSRTVI